MGIKIEIGKKYITCEGAEVEILSFDKRDDWDFPFMGRVVYPDNHHYFATFNENGEGYCKMHNIVSEVPNEQV